VESGLFFELSLTVENGNFAPQLHIQIVRAASAFWRDPLYVFGRVLDIASFAMDAVLRIDDKAWVCVTCLVRVNDLIDAGWAVEARRFPESGQIVTNGDIRVTQPKVNGLILFVIGVRKID
jgi:hypothetical protein